MREKRSLNLVDFNCSLKLTVFLEFSSSFPLGKLFASWKQVMVVDKYPIMFSRLVEVVVSKTDMLSDNREVMEFQDPRDRRLVTSLHGKTQEPTNSQTPQLPSKRKQELTNSEVMNQRINELTNQRTVKQTKQQTNKQANKETNEPKNNK